MTIRKRKKRKHTDKLDEAMKLGVEGHSNNEFVDLG